MREFRIYVACLASYNSGVLHGKWIDAATDVDDMQAEVSAMLRASKYPNVMVACLDCEGPLSVAELADPALAVADRCETCKGRGTVPSAEEWAIHDYDGKWPNFGEYPGLQAIADFMELVETAEGRGFPADDIAAVVDHFGRDYLSEARSAIEDNYHGTHRDLGEYAEQMIEGCYDLKNIPDIIKYHIDYDGIGRDMELGGDVFTVEASEGGVHVFSAC